MTLDQFRDEREETYTAQSYDVELVRTRDGERRTHHVSLPWDHGSLYWWTEGNNGCDCRRGPRFDGAVHPFDMDQYACGDTRYRIVRFIFPDGLIVDAPEEL